VRVSESESVGEEEERLCEIEIAGEGENESVREEEGDCVWERRERAREDKEESPVTRDRQPQSQGW
jgi:hypothetical protein